MSDTKNTDDKALSGAPKKTLTLSRRTVEQGTVRQSFSHGRTKAVVVEKKKSRGHGDGAPAPSTGPAAAPPPSRVAEGLQPRREPAPGNTPRPSERRPGAGGMVLRSLSQDELEARQAALAQALARDAEEKRRAAEEAVRREAEEKRRAAEEAETARREAEEAARREAEEARRAAEAPTEVAEPATAAPAPAAAPEPALAEAGAPAVTAQLRQGGDSKRPPVIEIPQPARPKALTPEEDEEAPVGAPPRPSPSRRRACLHRLPSSAPRRTAARAASPSPPPCRTTRVNAPARSPR